MGGGTILASPRTRLERSVGNRARRDRGPVITTRVIRAASIFSVVSGRRELSRLAGFSRSPAERAFHPNAYVAQHQSTAARTRAFDADLGGSGTPFRHGIGSIGGVDLDVHSVEEKLHRPGAVSLDGRIMTSIGPEPRINGGIDFRLGTRRRRASRDHRAGILGSLPVQPAFVVFALDGCGEAAINPNERFLPRCFQ